MNNRRENDENFHSDTSLDYLYEINSSDAELSALDKRIADYILSHSDEITSTSITLLAKRIGTSPAAITRFCQRLHYKGFSDFKYSLDNKEFLPPGRMTKLSVGDSLQVTCDKLDNIVREAVHDTLIHIDQRAIQQAARAICSASRVVIIADGGPGSSAEFAYRQLLQMGIIAYCVTDQHLASLLVTQLNHTDVLVCITRSGSSSTMLPIVSAAAEKRCTTIGITAYADSMLAKTSKITILYSSLIENDIRYLHVARICELLIIGVLQSAITKYWDPERAAYQISVKNAIEKLLITGRD